MTERTRLRIEEPDFIKSSHFDEPNILVHMRMNDRMIDGKKSLHLEEIQSDWHQQGREKGYKGKYKLNELSEVPKEESVASNPDLFWYVKAPDNVFQIPKSKAASLEEAKNYIVNNKSTGGLVPDAPFKKSWTELALKNAVREAAEKGYDKLSWTPGEAQAARYDLSNQVSEINYKKEGNQYLLGLKDKNGKVLPNQNIEANKLSDYVGKELAEKIKNNEGKEIVNGLKVFSGLDLKVGGQGMKGFYDQIVPKTLEKLTGEKVKVGDLGQIQPIVRYELRKSTTRNKYLVYDRDADVYLQDSKLFTKDEAQSLIDSHKDKTLVHYIDIPQSLKTKALKQGFPLFSTSPVLVPVDHDPFENIK